MRKAAFHTLGCKVNSYETEAMQELMLQAGYEIVGFNEKADVYIINTCSVTNIADRKSRQMLHKAKRMNPDAVTVAAGCYVQSAYESLKTDNEVDIIVGNNLKKDIALIIDEYFEKNKKSLNIVDIAGERQYEELFVPGMNSHTRGFIKIQDGCNQFCSYCIIPYTRGRVRSRDADSIMEEAKRLADGGCREIVLTGIHISSYGTDIENGPGLAKLTEELGRIEGIERIRLGSLEPGIIDREFMEILSGIDKLCPHFHLSLQSGSGSVLKRMNRRYTPDEFYEGVSLIREYYENAAITTDIIAGFPGETKEEFEESLAFARKADFYEMHVFPYSVREGTRAAAMENQIPADVKAERAQRLGELSDRMKQAYIEKNIGKKAEVLFESDIIEHEGVKYSVGHTREYLRAAIAYSGELRGSVKKGRLGRILYKDLILLEI